MPEHKALPDSELHYSKGASTAINNTILKANGDGTTSFVEPSTLVNVKRILAIEAASYVSQNPAAVDTPIQLSFGAAQATPYISLNALGTFTILQSGVYEIFSAFSMARTAGAGTAYLFSRYVKNGTPYSVPVGAALTDAIANRMFFATFFLNFTAGETFTQEFYRDSLGLNNGGVAPLATTLATWGDAPACIFRFNKIEGMVIP